MSVNHISVPLPLGVEPSKTDLELLQATFQAIIALRYENAVRRDAMLSVIEDEGWNVRWGLTWVAEARRGNDYEQATGSTTESALGCLYHLVQMAKLEGCP